MLKHLTLQNFRGFRTLEADFAPVSVLLGPNSSGKTTVLHAIRLACDAVHRALETDFKTNIFTEPADGREWIALAHNLVLGDHARFLPVMDWEALFVNQEVGPGIRFAIRLDFDPDDPVESIWVQVECGHNAQLKLSVSVLSPGIVERLGVVRRKTTASAEHLRRELREHAPRAVFIPPFYGTVPVEEFRGRAVVDQQLGAGEQSRVVRNLVMRLDPQQIIEMNAFLEDLVHTRISSRTPADDRERVLSLRVEFKDDNGPLELSAGGAGLTNLVALYSALALWRDEARRRRVLVLIDEPEAHLHARLQAQAANSLSTLVVTRYGAQLVMATHSLDIINALGERMDATLLRTDRQRDRPTTLRGQASMVDELSEWVDLTPFTAINFLASRKVLFHEGKSDAAILNRCGQLRFRNIPAHFDRFKEWTLASLEGTGQLGMGRLLATLVRSDAVARKRDPRPFTVYTVLDRDYTRQPGLVEEGDGLAMSYKLVWSRHSVESLFLDGGVLAAWVRAFAEDEAIDGLDRIIADAIRAADEDPGLIATAREGLLFNLGRAALLGQDLKPQEQAQRFREADREAERRATQEGAIWHRGHDRARTVLGLIRGRLPVRVKNRFPTDIATLLERTDLYRIGNLQAAIPVEILDLLDRLVART